MTEKGLVYISVDVEATGSYPPRFSLIEIGACLVEDPSVGYETFVRPTSGFYETGALRAIGVTWDGIKNRGPSPASAMSDFRKWVVAVSGRGRPVFVGFNAPYDWAFMNYYLLEFGFDNPFGHSALDVKAYAMAALGVEWNRTGKDKLPKEFVPDAPFTHRALDDARYQAEIFRRLREYRKTLG